MTDRHTLIRAVGVKGAVMMGLGSIVGTGVFVSLGLAAGLAGTAMIPALFLAGCLAVCNGLSSAQLAAAHPVSGGTYEYGYRFLNPWLGYLAGWLFVCAKSASAATAAIGFGGYFLRSVHIEALAPWQVGFAVAALMIVVTVFGIKRSNVTNIVIVSVTLLALLFYVLAVAGEVRSENYTPFFSSPVGEAARFPSFLEAAALLFVAYTGYGRIATLGEEIHDPVKNIPRAIIATLAISFLLYMLVAVVSVGAVGAERFYSATTEEAAPLEVIASLSGHPWAGGILAIGAMTAMLGVLLNLVLGLSRVVFAMGKRGDLPALFGKVEPRHKTPLAGVILSGLVILALVLMRDVKATWSFSAFTVLFYYAITNLSALRLPREQRLYPRAFAWLGLLGCLGLSVWVDRNALLLGGGLILAGILWRLAYRRITASSPTR